MLKKGISASAERSSNQLRSGCACQQVSYAAISVASPTFHHFRGVAQHAACYSFSNVVPVLQLTSGLSILTLTLASASPERHANVAAKVSEKAHTTRNAWNRQKNLHPVTVGVRSCSVKLMTCTLQKMMETHPYQNVE